MTGHSQLSLTGSSTDEIQTVPHNHILRKSSLQSNCRITVATQDYLTLKQSRNRMAATCSNPPHDRHPKLGNSRLKLKNQAGKRNARMGQLLTRLNSRTYRRSCKHLSQPCTINHKIGMLSPAAATVC